jgi:hypothetical protein
LTPAVGDAINGAMLRRGLVVLCVVAACGRGAGEPEPLGLVTSPPPPKPIEVDKARRDAGELARALTQRWRTAAAALGDHRLTIDSEVVVKDGATELERLGEHTVITSTAAGDYHAVADNSADYGREVIWLAGQLYLRPRYARWHHRPLEADDEPAAIRDQLAAVLGDYLELCARGVEVSDKGPRQVAGRAGHVVELKLTPSPRPATKATVTQRAWRDRVTVTAVAGEVVLDDAAGFALTARLTAEVTFERDGRPLTMAISVTHGVEVVATPTLAPPPADQVVTTAMRSTEVDDRNFLLKGLAPPERKAVPDDERLGTKP